MTKTNNNPIGVFDSGVGGLSVLRCAQAIMPDENYIYLGDFANAPYGNKSKKQIKKLSLSCAKMLIDMDIKALIIACNTASSAVAHILRNMYSLPIVAIEPAIIPASEYNSKKPIVVMATPQTLRLEKFNALLKSVNCRIESVACRGLAKLIEDEGSGSSIIKDYLKNTISKYTDKGILSVVIGCTHYSYIIEDIFDVMGDIRLFDGRFGAARQLKKLLENNISDGEGSVKLISTIDDDFHMALLNRFMNAKLVDIENPSLKDIR